MLTQCTTDTTIIASLGTTPNERGLTTDQFKGKFDKEATDIKAFINSSLKESEIMILMEV